MRREVRSNCNFQNPRRKHSEAIRGCAGEFILSAQNPLVARPCGFDSLLRHQHFSRLDVVFNKSQPASEKGFETFSPGGRDWVPGNDEFSVPNAQRTPSDVLMIGVSQDE